MLRRRGLQLLVRLQQPCGFPALLAAYSTSGGAAAPLYAACVLERLPILQPPAPAWEVEYKTYVQHLKAQTGQHKQYPAPDAKRAAKGDDAEADLRLAPTVTKADKDGTNSTMKRRLYDKLVLLVKAPLLVTTSTSSSSSGSSANSNSSGSVGWGFPMAEHQEGESIRTTAERALAAAIGPAQVFFIGNAPMAHLKLRGGGSSSSDAGSGSSAAADGPPDSSAAGDTQPGSQQQPPQQEGLDKPLGKTALYFHLAQVLNDPWEVQLQQEDAQDHAWVALDELPNYITDPQMLELARKWW